MTYPTVDLPVNLHAKIGLGRQRSDNMLAQTGKPCFSFGDIAFLDKID